jgi:hypothetical protein
MDWTIVVSVLIALLLWPLALASIAVVFMLPIVTVFRGRSQRVLAQMTSACMSHFQNMMADSQGEGTGPPGGNGLGLPQKTRGAAPCLDAAAGKKTEQHVVRS